jgi:hypothetical protein
MVDENLMMGPIYQHTLEEERLPKEYINQMI